MSSAIDLVGVNKSYKIYEQKMDFLKEALTGRTYHTEKPVLRDINLRVEPGEVVGIIGRNGAGKSTLLKVIAGTLSPTSGEISVVGRTSAILELGTGFNASYSGRENVFMSALMRGMSEEEIGEKFDSIVEFAGLVDVIDEPFHTYSSGMQARLAFAAAVAVEADVLIIDEALAAGDIKFAARCIERIHEICQSGVTALFVSHVSYHVMQLCSRAVWIDDGAVVQDGAPVEVVRAYEYAMHQEAADERGSVGNAHAVVSLPELSETPAVTDEPEPESEMPRAEDVLEEPAAEVEVEPEAEPQEAEGLETAEDPVAVVQGEQDSEAVIEEVVEPQPVEPEPVEPAEAQSGFSTGQYRIDSVAFLNAAGQPVDHVRFGEALEMRVEYTCMTPDLPEHSCGLAVAFNRKTDFEAVMYFNTNYPHSDEEMASYFDQPFRQYKGRQGVISAMLQPLQLNAGEYYVSFGLLPNQPGPHEFYEYRHCEHEFTVLANGYSEPSVFYPQVNWSHGPAEQQEREATR